MENANTYNSGKKALRPRARIVHTFGDELISSEVVAVIELVKNSYDADAKRVYIRFTGPLQTGQGRIEVIDSGHGMSINTIEKAWMEPATNFRKKDRLSENGRKVLGEKGIGRFAASRLAKKLEVISRRNGSDKEVVAFFDWTKFDDDSKYLDEVEVDWIERDPEEICPSGSLNILCWDTDDINPEKLVKGTILRMDSLNIDWDERKIDKLLDGLSRLLSPIDLNENKLKESFQIYVEFPQPFEHKNGVVKPSELFKYPHYILRGTIDDKGNYQLDIKIKDYDDISPLSGQFLINNRDPPSCGPVYLDFRVWDRDPESMKKLADRFDMKISDARNNLDKAMGVSIFRDGFRIMPYGEPGNDWLHLDKRRIQNPTLRLSNNQIVGYIEISGETNPQLRDQSNREGLMDGEALEDLKEIIASALTLLETRRYNARRPKGISKVVSSGLFTGFSIKPLQEQISKKYPGDTDLISSVVKREKELDDRLDKVKEVLSRYQRLATMGNLLDIVLHDGRTPLTKITQDSYLGIKETKNYPGHKGKALESLQTHFVDIKEESELLSVVFKRIEPFGGRRKGKPTSICIETCIINAFDLLNDEIKDTGATYKLPDSCTMGVVDDAEIQEIIINLLDNSLYWLHKKPKDQRKIIVLVNKVGPEQIEIIFSDSGPGIEPELQERIFEPYFSTKNNGIGLGLSITGEIISEYYNGSLELLNDGPLSGATFKILINRRI
jgi:hypothetical protein